MKINSILFVLFLCITSELQAESFIIPDPEPFSLDGRSAEFCINLLKNNLYLEIDRDTGDTTIIKVDTVWAFFMEFDPKYPAGHQKRYDIIVNRKPLNWDISFIEYGGEMINMRMLFLYRNQYPPEGLKYRD